MTYKRENLRMSYPAAFGIIAIMMFWLTVAAFGQTTEMEQTAAVKIDVQETEKKAVLQPVLTEYKGVKIGMTADEVRSTLDKKPKAEDKNGFYYVFSDGESAQITLDADKKVRMIAVMYIGDEAVAPKFEDVFGAETTVEKQTDGRVFKQVNYPETGYWVSYSRITVEDEPMITVTMQKMQ